MSNACQSAATLQEILGETALLALAMEHPPEHLVGEIEALRDALGAGDLSAATEQEIVSLHEVVRLRLGRARNR